MEKMGANKVLVVLRGQKHENTPYSQSPLSLCLSFSLSHTPFSLSLPLTLSLCPMSALPEEIH
jgi:hypothetical protein